MNALPQNPLEFNGIIDLMDNIPDDQAAPEYFKMIRWAGQVTCPYCASSDILTRRNGKTYDCKGCKVHFTAKSATIFAHTKVGMRKWMKAKYMLSSNKKELSSYDLSRNVKVTQKTAWLMHAKIQTAFVNGGFDNKATDAVEFDETFVGGKEANKHWDKRTLGTEGRSTKKKTDEFTAYSPLARKYNHKMLDHGAGIFACDEDNDTTGMSFEEMVRRVAKGGDGKQEPKEPRRGNQKDKEASELDHAPPILA